MCTSLHLLALSIPFFKLTVPTVDTVRYEFLCMALIRTQNPVLLVGSVGTGKTSVIESTLTKFEKDEFNMLTVNMSAQVGNTLEVRCDGKVKDHFLCATSLIRRKSRNIFLKAIVISCLHNYMHALTGVSKYSSLSPGVCVSPRHS